LNVTASSSSPGCGGGAATNTVTSAATTTSHTTEDTSLEMVQISMASTSSVSTDKNDYLTTTAAAEQDSSLDQKTLMDDLPSLPSDQQPQPLSLSDIHFEEGGEGDEGKQDFGSG
jgi:hypothetical protein